MAAPMSSFLSTLGRKWKQSYNSLKLIIDIYTKNGPPPSLAVVTSMPVSSSHHGDQFVTSDLNSIFGGVLYAVQRARRTVEKRLKRKHAFTGHYEHAVPKTNIVPCLECGNFREKGHLCKHCYEKVRKETKLMQEKMGEDLSIQVPTKEVAYVYDGESISKDGKFVVEMDKPRPSWFPRKLLNKTS